MGKTDTVTVGRMMMDLLSQRLYVVALLIMIVLQKASGFGWTGNDIGLYRRETKLMATANANEEKHVETILFVECGESF